MNFVELKIKIMGVYRISGVWKNGSTITHYAIHEVVNDRVTRADKVSKQEAVALLEKTGNSATTWTWSYRNSDWIKGETVEVVNGASGKYLRSYPDGTLSDNLGHLINYDWIK